MDGPDAKRARLDHEPTSYPSSGHPLRPASTPVIPPPHHSHVGPPASAPALAHSYSVPPPGSGQSAHHAAPYRSPSVPQGQAPSRENGADLHRPNQYPATSHSVATDHSSGYGIGPANHLLPYPASTQSGSVPPPPPPTGYDSRRASSAERLSSTMAEHQHHHGGHPLQHATPQPYQAAMEHHMNGAAPHNGLPFHPPDTYAVGPAPHHNAYPATPSATYHPGPMYGQGPSQYVGQPRRKQVRATQACNQCRQRKQKCDENRPCGYCSNEGIGADCTYKEVPPPKTDRHIVQMLEQQSKIEENIMDLRQMQESMHHLLEQATKSLDMNKARLATHSGFSNMPQAGYATEGAAIITEDAKNVDTSGDVDEQSQDQPPASHETGAQYLVQWPFIGDYFKSAGVDSAEYVLDEMEKSSTLRPYGLTQIENGQILDPPQDDGWDEDTKEQNTEDLLEDMWGNGPATRNPNNGPNIGGGNPDGSLDLVQATVWKLYDSYMRHMWVLHPFIDVKWLNSKIEEFVGKHSPASFPPSHMDGHFAMPGVPASSVRPDTPSSMNGKRKRQSNASDDTPDYVSSESNRRWQAPKKTPDRSMQNAIILLVLALGKALLNDRFLLEEFAVRTPSVDPSESSHANSPHDASKPSPRPHLAYEAVSSPSELKAAAMARGASYEGARPKRPRKNIKVHNVELYPGLAYFAHASNILGEHLGGNTVMHAQAFLLAGIYYGQLGRVTESWSWINEGLRVTTILSNKKKYRPFLLSRPVHPGAPIDSRVNEPRNLLVAFLCWSALQLESDLRAELDQLPQPSQLMYSEARIMFPPRLVGVPPGAGQIVQLPHDPPLKADDVLHSFHFQNVRNLLHTATSFWWPDSTKLSEDLLEARLRAKYYGGEYIILRPYIYNALRWAQDTQGIRPPFDLAAWVKKYDEDEREATVQRVYNHNRNVPHDAREERLPEVEISYEAFHNNRELAEKFLWCCKRCIDAAMASTEVFDGVASPIQDRRLRVTNIHGTATAQFSNMLVLCAASRSWLAAMVDKDELWKLMERTIALHDKLSPLAPIFRTNRKVLIAARRETFGTELMAHRGHATYQASPSSYHGSQPAMSPGTAGTPRQPYAQPAPTSATSSFSSVRY